MIRAFNASRATIGGPFSDFEAAFQWAVKNLPMYRNQTFSTCEKNFIDQGRVCIMEAGGENMSFAEDVVIFDDNRFPPDEDGYIDW